MHLTILPSHVKSKYY